MWNATDEQKRNVSKKNIATWLAFERMLPWSGTILLIATASTRNVTVSCRNTENKQDKKRQSNKDTELQRCSTMFSFIWIRYQHQHGLWINSHFRCLRKCIIIYFDFTVYSLSKWIELGDRMLGAVTVWTRVTFQKCCWWWHILNNRPNHNLKVTLSEE